MTKCEQLLKELQSRADCFEFRSYEMSGFGKDTTYEMGMQRMLWLGMEWLKGKKIRVFDGMWNNPRIIGVEFTEGTQLGELEEIWREDAFLKEGGITGAMHQFVLHHLKVISEEGYEGWLKLLEEKGADESSFFMVRMWR